MNMIGVILASAVLWILHDKVHFSAGQVIVTLGVVTLGATLYKAATGEVPFSSNDWFELARMHVEDAPPSLRRKRGELSKRFERVVMKCLAKHPDDRYANAAELLADLDEVEQKRRSTTALATAPMGSAQRQAPADQPAQRGTWLVVAGVALGLLLLIGLVVKLMR